ncbi:MAG TPA: group II intron reverse transcriptase/maturase [Pyrinomonadaceae bacterium]|nr:group II intron reverse transcriptase/maturase [Pyrinomonadaceae bacterium]
MGAKQQKSQQQLAFASDGKVKPEASLSEGTETLAAGSTTESQVRNERLMEVMLGRENLQQALRRVEENKGAAGVDGMGVKELRPYLKQYWRQLRAELLSGKYQPAPVRRVEIPKAGGGMRKLGIPTVVDRFIQQAMLQVLQADWDASFSAHSYGFRPGRTAHEAIAKAQEYLNAGYETVVDIDLEKFFDRVNHDVLMSRVARRVADKRVLKLIRAYLNSGVLENGLVSATEEGTPQGGPLSPLLSNLLLDEWDRELERRGHRFVRYADDCNIYVRSERAGERVLAGMKQFLSKRLRLKINEQKSAVGKPSERKFLGYSFTSRTPKRRKIAAPSVQRFKERVRELTKRGRKVQLVITKLSRYLRGWAGYYERTECRSQLQELDGWVRRRLRCYLWRAWQRTQRRYRILRQHGVPARQAWQVVHYGPWRASRSQAISRVLPNAYFQSLGLYSLSRS